jgi:signal transduction histidine kinase
LWSSWTAGTAILLFATSTPIYGDFAPLLLGLLTGIVGSMTSLRSGLLSAVSAAALVCLAAAVHRLDVFPLYLSFIGIGWMVGYLMRIQQQLIVAMREAQAQLTEHAAADERRRIAREVHDVIAHSLSVTLLHVTGARRALQQDRDVDDAVGALEQAESLGRQAMTDIRHTVGLLDDGAGRLDPEPGAADIGALVEDFARAGLDITFDVHGQLDRVSAACGLALYRIAQESLANVAKHAPDSASTMLLDVSRVNATLTVTNRVAVPVAVAGRTEGRGTRGMRQRIELLGGTIEIGPSAQGWSVHAVLPMDNGGRAGWGCSG